MEFIITKELLEENIKVLAEIPAKFSFGMIDALRKLPAMHEKEEDKKEVPAEAEKDA